MKRARAVCIGEENDYWDDIEPFIQSCAELMISQINQQKIALLKPFNYANKSISYAK